MNEVKDEEWCIADFPYGGSRHIWTQPKEDDSPALYLDANFDKIFRIDDISSVFHYELIIKNGGLNSDMTGEGKGEIRCSGFDGMLLEDEMSNLPVAVSFSHASEDQLFDVDFAKKVPDLDYRFCDELSSGDLRSEIHSPGTSNEVGVSESSILEPKCFFDRFRQSSADEMHGDSGSKCWHERPLEDKMNFTSSQTHECEIHDFLKTFNTRSSLENACTFGHDREKSHCSFSSVKPPCTSIGTLDDAGSVSQCTEVEDFCADSLSTDSCAETQIANTRQRRSSRPPLRYLDGSPWLKSRLFGEKKHSISLRKEKDLEVRYQKKYGRKALEIRASKAPASNLELDSDEEYEPVSSRFNIRKSMKRSDRRKNSKPWTLDEVAALINGMSQFGTGQWTSVKRAFFSSSSRTATDIRDKWRNLVKTNIQISKAGKDDQHQRSGSQPLPKTLIDCVREIVKDPPVRKSTCKRGQRFSGLR